MNDVIETERLWLLPITPEQMTAYSLSRSDLARLIGATVPENWPVCPEGMEYWRAKSNVLRESKGWAGYVYIHKKDNTVIGDGGFKGPPDAKGEVEMGYAILPEYRGKGLGTEAAKALVDWAFYHPEVESIVAETLPEAKGSMRVLEKLRMAYQGIRVDPGEGRVFLWRLRRKDFVTPCTPPENDNCPNG